MKERIEREVNDTKIGAIPRKRKEKVHEKQGPYQGEGQENRGHTKGRVQEPLIQPSLYRALLMGKNDCTPFQRT